MDIRVPNPILALTEQPINKPMHEQYFMHRASNAKVRFEATAKRGYIMPDSFFFVRNHTSTPSIDDKTWKLRVEGDGVEKPLKLNYDALLKLPPRTVTFFVECAGNSRSLFDTLLEKPVPGEQWSREYNQVRPHSSLGYLAPLEFAGVQMAK